MKKIILILAVLCSVFASAQITHNATYIIPDGTTTGDDLRTYMVANGLGQVIDRTIIFDRHLRFGDTASFTDNDFTYIFPSSWHIDGTGVSVPLIDLEDGVIIYTEGAKSHTSQPRATILRLTNVQYRIEGNTGRTDFFDYRDSGFEFINVQFISYGGNNFLHLPTTGGLLENVTVKIGSGNLVFQPDANPGETLIMRNWTLNGVNSIIGNGGGNLTAVTRLENLTWPRLNWDIGRSNRGQTYIVVNPNKPVGWTGYSGLKNATNDMYEVHTHNIKIIDENKTALQNYRVQLRRDDNTTLEYNLQTDLNGNIPEQEVLTYEQVNNNVFTQYNGFMLTGISFNNQIISGIRNLADGKIDEIITSITDFSITEENKTIVDAYTTQETPAKAYDHLKAILVDNYAGETATYVTTNLGKTSINAGAYDVEINGTGSGAPTIAGNKITLNAAIFEGEITTTGTLTFINGAIIKGGYSDNTGIYKYIDLTWTDPSTQNINVINNDDNSIIFGPASSTQTYSNHILMPTPQPVNGITVTINSTITNDVLFSETIDLDTLTLIREQIVLSSIATSSNQQQMFRLLERVLVKSEAIKNGLNNAANVPLTVNETVTNSTVFATTVNQNQMLDLLKLILRKVSASRASLIDN